VRGLYIVIEGIVGSGKSTQSELLSHYLSNRFPKRTIINTYEPGGSQIADTIRTLVQATEFEEEMTPWCDAYLYASSRAQTLSSIVKPSIEQGNIVISDRSFISSIAIQGCAQGLGSETVLNINKPLFDTAFPDIILYFYIPPHIGLSRIYDSKGDKFEKRAIDFYEKLVRAYDDISKYPIFKGKWQTICVEDKTVEHVHNDVRQIIEEYLDKLGIEGLSNEQTNSKQLELDY
jgi:dTMP kinase